MLGEPEQILESIRKRELDIEIMELQLKHKLTKKRAECKLLIMYYKACNAMSRAKLMMHEIGGCDIEAPHAPNPPTEIDPLSDHREKRI